MTIADRDDEQNDPWMISAWERLARLRAAGDLDAARRLKRRMVYRRNQLRALRDPNPPCEIHLLGKIE